MKEGVIEPWRPKGGCDDTGLTPSLCGIIPLRRKISKDLILDRNVFLLQYLGPVSNIKIK